MTLRTSQSARNMFSVKHQLALNDCIPYWQQNILTANSSPVNASTAFVNSGLYVEMSSAIAGSPIGSCWFVYASVFITTNGTAGAQLQLAASDGLQIVSSSLQFTLSAAAAAATVVAAVGSPATSGAINVIAGQVSGVVTVLGEGRLNLQFTQAVSTAVNTTVNNLSYMEGYTLLP